MTAPDMQKIAVSMHKLLVLSMMITLSTSCHRGVKNQLDNVGKTFHFRFNPPDSSTYRYHTTCETVLTVVENGKISRLQRTSQFTVDYLISKDRGDIVLDMTFGESNYHEWNVPATQNGNAADVPGPVYEMLNRIKTATIFVRVRPVDLTVTMGGARELAYSGVDAYYAAADREQARAYWGQWAEEQLVWKNIAPFTWVALDSVRYLGHQWTDVSTNAEDINFKINKHLRFDSLSEGIATIRSQGRISNDQAGTWLSGRLVTGTLTGNEIGRCLVDTATGMPTEMEEEVQAQGNVEIEGRKGSIKIINTIRLVGRKLK